jgi:hypothetical protein
MAREVTQLAGDLPRHHTTISTKIKRFSGIAEGTTVEALERAEVVIQPLSLKRPLQDIELKRLPSRCQRKRMAACKGTQAVHFVQKQGGEVT